MPFIAAIDSCANSPDKNGHNLLGIATDNLFSPTVCQPIAFVDPRRVMIGAGVPGSLATLLLLKRQRYMLRWIDAFVYAYCKASRPGYRNPSLTAKSSAATSASDRSPPAGRRGSASPGFSAITTERG
jgi:hypothetical protein